MLELLTGAILGFCIGGLTVLLYMSLKEPDPAWMDQIDKDNARICEIEKSLKWQTDRINSYNIKIEEHAALLKALDKYARELDEYMHNVI